MTKWFFCLKDREKKSETNPQDAEVVSTQFLLRKLYSLQEKGSDTFLTADSPGLGLGIRDGSINPESGACGFGSLLRLVLTFNVTIKFPWTGKVTQVNQVADHYTWWRVYTRAVRRKTQSNTRHTFDTNEDEYFISLWFMSCLHYGGVSVYNALVRMGFVVLCVNL